MDVLGAEVDTSVEQQVSITRPSIAPRLSISLLLHLWLLTLVPTFRLGIFTYQKSGSK